MSEESDKTEKSENSEATVETLKSELEKSKKDYLYLLAEFDNYRRNSIKERSDLTKFGAEKFVREFLTVFDNFERALATDSKPENFATFREGVQMIASELRSLLQRFSISETAALGQPFDPTQQEALSSEPRDDMPPGHVAQVFSKGYKMHDRLIRPAQVVVAAAKSQEN